MSDPRYILTRDGLYVLDSFYCYREVYRPPGGRSDLGQARYFVPHAQRVARAVCAQFNAEEEASVAA